MDSPERKERPPSFVEFLAFLRQQPGFGHLGVDHYVRFHSLLDKVGRDLLKGPRPDELKNLFCPIFATTKEQQEQFQQAIETYFSRFEPGDPSPGGASVEPGAETASTPPGKIKLQESFRSLKSAAPLLLVSLFLGGLIVWLIVLVDTANRGTSTSLPGQTGAGNQQGPTNGPGQNTAQPDPVGAGDGGQRPPGDPPTAGSSPVLPAGAAYSRVSVPLGAVALLLLLFVSYESYKYVRRQQYLRRQLNKKPALVWRVPTGGGVSPEFNAEKFSKTVRRMRERQVDEFDHLDVPATVAATIDSLGYTRLCYRPATRVPEYLVLIDRASFSDHQSYLFSELMGDVKGKGVDVLRLYFEDPLVCTDDKGRSLHLADLKLYEGSRLLIFSDGARLLDPLTGEPATWCELYRSWTDRALLTPRPVSQWGLREANLSDLFVVIPANLNGLSALVDHLEAAARPPLKSWRRLNETPVPFIGEGPEALPPLRQYLGEPGFTWLCACAVYPELQWELTMRLGLLLSDGTRLLAEESLLRLIRLPWFRTGSIPDELREPLIAQLGSERENEVRSLLIGLMKERLPACGSDAKRRTVAEMALGVNFAAQMWLRYGDRESYQRVIRDKTLLRNLKPEHAPSLQRRLPARWAAYLFKDSIPAFGLRTVVRLVLTLFAASLVCLGILIYFLFFNAPQPAVDVNRNVNTNTTTDRANSNTNATSGNTNAGNTNAGNTNAGNTNASGNTNANLGNSNGNSANFNTNGSSGNSNSNAGDGYSLLSTKRLGVRRQWAYVETYLQRRADLIPNLVEAARSAGVEEQEVFGQIAEARSKLVNATSAPPEGEGGDKTPAQRQAVIDAANNFGVTLGRLFSLQETYPQLRSSELFMKVQDELSGTENRINVAREDYNGAVSDYNAERVRRGAVGTAGLEEFKEEPFFRADAGGRAMPVTTVPQPPVNVGSLVGKASRRIAPIYPADAVRSRVTGAVTVYLVVSEKGEVESVQRIEGPQQLQQAAAAAARRWTFEPTIIDGKPVRVTGYLIFNFTP